MLAGYYHQFIKYFAGNPVLLHTVTSKKKKFRWVEGEEESFEMLKKALASLPVLAFADLEKPFIVEDDASSTEFGAFLSQKQLESKKTPYNMQLAP